jgi:hypothetical protein
MEVKAVEPETVEPEAVEYRRRGVKVDGVQA